MHLPTPSLAAATHLRTGRRALGCSLAVIALVALGGPAAGHGITADAATAGAPGFVIIGIEHMLLGWDHVLFVAGVILLAHDLRQGARTIGVFVLGHSFTLITATLAGWQVDPVLVDVVIIVSVAVVGLIGLFGSLKHWDVFMGLVFCFGLVHGLGLATRFQDLGVADDGLVWRLIAFNVGIEIGQVTAIVAILGIGALASMLLGGRHDAGLTKVAYLALFAVGAMVAPLFALSRLSDDSSSDIDVALPDGAPCVVDARSQTFPDAGGGHTEKKFYEPDETVPIENFGHVLGDGYVVVLYPDTLTGEDLDALRDFVTETETTPVVAGARSERAIGNGPVDVVTSDLQMTCDDLHIGALRQFSDAWLESLGYEAAGATS